MLGIAADCDEVFLWGGGCFCFSTFADYVEMSKTLYKFTHQGQNTSIEAWQRRVSVPPAGGV